MKKNSPTSWRFRHHPRWRPWPGHWWQRDVSCPRAKMLRRQVTSSPRVETFLWMGHKDIAWESFVFVVFFLLCGEKIGIFDLCLLERTGSFLKIFLNEYKRQHVKDLDTFGGFPLFFGGGISNPYRNHPILNPPKYFLCCFHYR